MRWYDKGRKNAPAAAGKSMLPDGKCCGNKVTIVRNLTNFNVIVKSGASRRNPVSSLLTIF
jgi:hypothetical protein